MATNEIINLEEKRVAIFGGTFNPIHLGHLRIAEEVAYLAGFDEMMFIPNRTPPHRQNPQVSAQQRLEMVRLAVAGNPRFTVNTIEVDDTDFTLSYTYCTVSLLRRQYPNYKFSMICGSDVQPHQWYRFEDLIALLEGLYIVYRPGYDNASLEERIRESLHGDSVAWQKYHWVQTLGISISSTQVRELLAQGQSVRYLLPDSVVDYIAEHGLYASSDDELES